MTTSISAATAVPLSAGHRLARAIGSEFVHGAYFTALAALGVFAEELLLLRYQATWLLAALAFLLPLVVYNVDHLRGIESDARTNPERAAHLAESLKARRVIVGVQTALLLGACALAPRPVALGALVLCGLGLLYPKRLTAAVPAFKSFYVAGSLGSLAVLALAWYPERFDALAVAVALGFVFLRLFLNVVFSDVKDVESDAAEGLRTVPVMLGAKRTLVFLRVLNVVSFAPLLGGIAVGALPGYAALLLLMAPYTAWYLHVSQREREMGSRPGRASIVTHMMSEGEFIIGPALMAAGTIILG